MNAPPRGHPVARLALRRVSAELAPDKVPVFHVFAEMYARMTGDAVAPVPVAGAAAPPCYPNGRAS